jgi:hypothetical protein
MKLFSKGDAIRSPEFHKKKEKERWIKIIALILFLFVFIATPIYLFRMNQFLISNIELKGNNVTKYEDVARIASENLDGNYLFIFPKSNALIYPKNKIRNDLLKNIPRINEVKVSLSNPKSLKIEINEREPAGLYCDSQKINSAECYFIDEDGFIFSRAPSFSGDVYFIYSSDPIIEDPLGKNYSTKDEFQKLPPLIHSLKEIHVPLRSLTTTVNEYYLELLGGGKIIIGKKDNLTDVASNLESFLNDQAVTKAPGFLDNVSYIDMRFGNKVFYKLKGEI